MVLGDRCHTHGKARRYTSENNGGNDGIIQGGREEVYAIKSLWHANRLLPFNTRWRRLPTIYVGHKTHTDEYDA